MKAELVDKRADRHAHHVGVEPRQRVDPGQQPGREAVRDALDAQHQARDGVLTQGGSAYREAAVLLRVPRDMGTASQIVGSGFRRPQRRGSGLLATVVELSHRMSVRLPEHPYGPSLDARLTAP